MSLFIVANAAVNILVQRVLFFFVECCSESHTKAGVSSGRGACTALLHLSPTLLARGAVGPWHWSPGQPQMDGVTEENNLEPHLCFWKKPQHSPGRMWDQAADTGAQSPCPLGCQFLGASPFALAALWQAESQGALHF